MWSESVRLIFGLVSDIVISFEAIVPVVTIFCDPKLGAIFVPAIAAVFVTSAFSMVKLPFILPSATFTSIPKVPPAQITPDAKPQ